MNSIGRPRHLLAKAEYAHIAGRGAAAIRALERAQELAESRGQVLEAAQAKAALSRLGDVPEAKRRQLRDAAAVAFSRLGCGWHAMQLRGDDQQGQSQ